MKRYKHNGEYWYRDTQSPLALLLRWFVHIGGWHMPHWTTEGYAYRWHLPAIRRAFSGRGYSSRLFAVYCSMCPISLFGGRFVFQSFGVGYWSRRRQAWYCLHRHKATSPRWYAYRAVNATPWGADRWYFGTPRDVIAAAQAQHDQMRAAREEREQRATAAS